MGFVSKDIAVITEPDIVTLSAVPNFVQFASKPASKTYLEVDIHVNINSGFNRLNPNTVTDHTAAYPPNGDIRPNDNLGITAYIEADASNLYTLLNRNTNLGEGYIVFYYDANRVMLGYDSTGPLSSWSFTTPPKCRYVRLDITSPSFASGISFANFGLFRSSNPEWQPFNTAYTNVSALTQIRITDASGAIHTYRGTINAEDVGGSTFYIASETSDTAENLRQVLLADKWFSSNFEAVIPFDWTGNTSRNGSILNIKSKGAGTDFNISIVAPNNTGNIAYTITWLNQTSVNNDSISGEASTAEIDIDIYTDPDVFLGSDDRPITPAKIGTYATTMQKTYAGSPVWFELNALFSQYGSYNRPPGTSGWFDTGTSRTYRFTAKVKAINSFYFYQSNALYVLHGYGPVSEDLDLSQYVYNDNTVKLLTNKPRTPYIRGQKEYLNFIFSDPQRGVSQPINFTLRIAYRAYTTSDNYIGTVYSDEKARADFAIVNTCQLNIDTVLDQYPTAGIIRVALARGTALVSNDLEYVVRPDCLHTLRQFSFINRLGGWDAFNFDAGIKDEIKPSVETYNKTLTPSYQKGDSVETVYNTTLANTFTIEGAPVTDDVAAWLKELAAARVILDNDGNYIIIEDFTLQVTAANKNMQKPTIKYRLSE